jgi:iron complex transport system substrate-binding protein
VPVVRAPFPRRRAPIASLLIAALLLALAVGCSDGGDPASGPAVAPSDAPTAVAAAPEAAPVLPVTVPGVGGDVTVESVARIIPVDGDLAEIVFALGLGDNVVATDLSATYPQEAADRPEIG